jgi:class 3 adenylate cyclase/pimeloyl-ACP methyl ester carboxylesterase
VSVVPDIGVWLRSLGLGRYEEAFRANEVDAEVLPSLTAEDLTDIGVRAVGHRRKLVDAINALRADDALEEDRPDQFPPEPAADPPPIRRSPDAERRQLTVMFCDLVGSTALSTRLDPEDLREVVGAYHRCAAEIVTRLEGHVAQYLGDGVLAYFGYPHAHENEAERAVLAALELIDGVRALRPGMEPGLEVRVGIATGLAVIGDLLREGAPDEGEAAVGETPNLAARMQGLALPGTIVISDPTRQLLGELFELADLGTQTIKGFAEPVRSWRVVGESAAEGRFEALHGGQLLPLLGREHELGLFLDRWEQATEGEGQVVLLSGEPGIGKSRILRALRERLAVEQYRALTHYCSPYYTNTALYPLISMLERVSGLNRDDSGETQLSKLTALLSLSQTSLDEAVPLLAALLSIPGDPALPPLRLSPQRQKQRTLEILHEQLAGLAAVQPILSIYEDVQWADPSTLELLDLLVDRVQNLPVLLVATSRSGFPARWTSYAHVSTLTLNRLPQRRASSMIDHLTVGKTLPPEVVDQILAKTDGIPLFVEELTKVVLESGLVRDLGDRFVLTGPLPPLAIPATLQDSLMARLDRLAPVKDVAQVGAAIGREFSYELLKAVAGRPEEDLHRALDQLVSAELIFRRGAPPAARYSFKHALVQDAAYESMLKARRRELHARIAQALVSESAGHVEASSEVIAEHFARAGWYDKAAERWLRAGEQAKAAYANREAVSHLHNCLDALERCTTGAGLHEHETTNVSALTLLGDLAGISGDLKKANQFYDQALALSSDVDHRASIANKFHHPHAARRDGATIAFYAHGSGQQTLVLVNPLVYGLSLFQPILERLSQDFRIITVDCRGTGDSDPLTRPFPLREHAKDIAAVMDSLKGQPIIGVGLSRGSNLLIRLAAERPELMSQLITVGCPLVPGGFDGLESFSGYWVECPKAHAREDVEGLLRILASYMFTEPGTVEIQRAFIERGLQLPPGTVLSFYDPDPDVDVSPLLEHMRVPTLVTHGRADQLIPFSGAEYLASELPDAELHGFEGKGHLPIFTAPDEFCDSVREFVGRTSVPGSRLAARGDRRRVVSRPPVER